MILRRNIFTLLTAAAILYLSLAPQKDFDGFHIIIPHFDKLVHAGMYFVLMSAILFENRSVLLSRTRLIIAASLAFLYGVIMEFLQMLTPGRSASFYDGLADLAGVMLALLTIRLIREKLSDNNQL